MKHKHSPIQCGTFVHETNDPSAPETILPLSSLLFPRFLLFIFSRSWTTFATVSLPSLIKRHGCYGGMILSENVCRKELLGIRCTRILLYVYICALTSVPRRLGAAMAHSSARLNTPSSTSVASNLCTVRRLLTRFWNPTAVC